MATQGIQIDPLEGRLLWEQAHHRLVIKLDRKRGDRVYYEDEKESGESTLVVDFGDAPATGSLNKPKASDYR